MQMVLLKNKLKKFIYSRTLRSLKKVSAETIQKESEQKAIKAFHAARERFPQYQTLINQKTGDTPRISTIDSFKRHVPILDKDTIYNTNIALDMALAHQENYPRLLLSSGSSGHFSFGLSFRSQIAQDGEFLNVLLNSYFSILTKKTLIINCLTVVHLPDVDAAICEVGPRADSLLYLLQTVSPQFDQTIIIGDNYFIKNALEDGLDLKINYPALHIHLILGGVYLPENLRKHLKVLLNNGQADAGESLIFSSMGISEFGLNLFFESEETIRLRQFIEDGGGKEKLLDKDDPDYTPMVFNYFPQMFYIEEIQKELVVTSFNAQSFLPFIRYNTRDRLKIISYMDLEKLLSSEPALKSSFPPFKSPLILMYGKNEYAQFNGLKVYPPQIQKALYKDFSLAIKTTGYFRINTIDKTIEIQLKKGIEPSDELKTQFQNAIHRQIPLHLPINLYAYNHFPYGMDLDYQRKFKYL
jgi:phenylacetate-CoA ligase